MMLNRSNDVELDFDFKKVKEKTKDNPVFYVNMLMQGSTQLQDHLK